MLTDAQQAVAYAEIANRAVYAGPGSGKTFVLTHHLVHAIRAHRIRPNEIYVLTFTRQAAQELKQRLLHSTQLSPQEVASLHVGTFHSVIFRLLLSMRTEVRPLLPQAEQLRLMRGVIQQVGRGQDRAVDWLTRFALWHAEWPAPMAPTKQVQRVLVHYHAVKQRLRVWDFDDVLTTFCREWDTGNRTLPTMRYLLVDEFQDTNAIQLYILRCLHGHFGAPVFVVGDEDQSIYGFRGASPKWLLQFPERFPAVTTHALPDNFRSDAAIVRHTQDLIVHNQQRSGKRPTIRSNTEGCVQALTWDDERMERRGVLRRLEVIAKTSSSVAILGRTRSQLQALASNLVGEARSRIHMHTFHDAKGKEWDEVHLIGAVEKNPHLRTDVECADDEEERRLFYVAMTRSRHRLFIHVPFRSGGQKMHASPFLQQAHLSSSDGLSSSLLIDQLNSTVL